MTRSSATVRPAEARDREAFLAMWQEFVALAPDEPGNHAMGDLNWERIMDAGNGMRCIMAVDKQDQPCGFTLFLAFPFSWSTGDICYLQDIFVNPVSRGKGIAQAMIAHLRTIGEQAGWFKIFWMTQHDNYTAQHLYDKIATRTDYVRYDLIISAP